MQHTAKSLLQTCVSSLTDDHDAVDESVNNHIEGCKSATTAAPTTVDMSTHRTPHDAGEEGRRELDGEPGSSDHSDRPAIMDMQDDDHFEDHDMSTALLLGLNENLDQPSAEVETWADSCLVFTVDNDDMETLQNEFLDSLMKRNPNVNEILNRESYALSGSKATSALPSSQHSSSGKSLIETATEKASEKDSDEFAYEETDDPTLLLYKGEKFALFDGDLWQDGEKDSGIEEVSLTSLVDVESVENIFKVWDLRISDDDEEDELTLEMRKALGEDYYELPHMTRKFDEPSVTLNMQELDELVSGLTDLSLTEIPSSPSAPKPPNFATD